MLPLREGYTMQQLLSCTTFAIFVVAPLALAVGAVLGSISASSHGQTGLGVLALLAAILCAGFWLLALPARFLALKG
jgi:hypothetical protein